MMKREESSEEEDEWEWRREVREDVGWEQTTGGGSGGECSPSMEGNSKRGMYDIEVKQSKTTHCIEEYGRLEDPRQCWGDYTTNNLLVDADGGYNSLRELNEDEIIHDIDPLLMLPPPHHSKWMLKKVAGVK